MKFINKETFMKTEADSYFERNKEKLLNYSKDQDNVLKTITDYSIKINKICEIGCGSGVRLDYIQKNLNPSLVVGVDPSKKGINYGKKLNSKIQFFNGTSDDLNFIQNKSLDIVILGFFLYVLDRDLLLKSVFEIDRILNNNGYLIIHDFYSKTPSIKKYSHIKDKSSFIYKQKYHEIFLSTHEYELLDFKCINHNSNILDAKSDTDDLTSVVL